jgi:PAS domain S-box-containing protein
VRCSATRSSRATARGSKRQRGRLVAAENERRFRQYFEHHPLPMLIFDVETLAIMAVNVAAAAQYGYPAGELCRRDMASLYAQADMPAFLRDLQHLRTSGTGSGSAGICRHRRSDGRAMYVDLSYHFRRTRSATPASSPRST